jgi:putative peptide zinc metalloprotease protein
MAGTFLSDNWYRVAAMKPRLRQHARVSRQRFRGNAWYMVYDPLTNRSHRFSPSAWWIASQLNGSVSVDDAWQRSVTALGAEGPSQDDVIRLLSKLHGADLLISETQPESDELMERRRKQMVPKWVSGLMNPMSIRVPLWDPDRFLTRTLRYVQPLFGPAGLLLWLAVTLPAFFLALQHWSQLTANLSDRLLSAGNLVGMLLVFPIVKMLHELGHGYAVKAHGGEVHEAGIMLLVFAPAPYVDASASIVFRSKWYRAFVAAAGMVTELFLAAIALYIWLAVEPGVVHTIAFNVMMVTGISTLIFNANPLLRYDGYFILCDVIEIPNLGQRSNQYYGYLVRRYCFRDAEALPPNASPAERRWFVLYAPAAFIYRSTVSLSIALFVANKYFFVGTAMAIWSVAGMMVFPVYKQLRFLLSSPMLARRRSFALMITTGVACAVLIFAVFVPLPGSTVTQGVVWVPAGGEVHAAGSGFVQRNLATSMLPVADRQPLLVQDDRTLDAQYAEQLAKVAELNVKVVLDLSEDRARAYQSNQTLERERGQLNALERRLDELVTLAPGQGMFVRATGDSLEGRFVKRGELLGYVLGTDLRTVRVVIAQDEIGMVLGRTRAVEIKFSDRLGETFNGRIVRVVPQGDERLPSKALTIDGGGEFVLDPRDPAALRTLDKVFQLDLEVPVAPPGLRIGTRSFVRFDFEPEPLVAQAARRLRQLFLSKLHV